MISRILYYCFLLPISHLPFSVLYGVSDIFSFLLYNVFPYRKKVVYTNLRNSFPEKSEKEIEAIAKKFYSHFCDLIVESVKGFSISAKSVQKRITTENRKVLDQYAHAGRDAIVVTGHFGNWEMLAIAGKYAMDGTLVGVYKMLNNAFFEQKMLSSRGKFGTKMISTKFFKRDFEMLREKGEPLVLGLVMDQAPFKSRRAYWTTFLNQDTAVLFGAESNAKKYDIPVIYGKIAKEKRGYYKVHYQLISDKPRQTKYGEITEEMSKLLEKDVRVEPHFWLWTHKRWKKKKPPESELPQYQQNPPAAHE